MLLCADIGGTKTKLALFARNAPCRPVRVATYQNAEAGDLGDILARFLGEAPAQLDAVSFGVAGPVFGARVDTTNLPWTIDGDALAHHFGAPVYLLNDLEALAYGVSVLADASCAVLHPGTPVPHGARAVIAAGTGLGEGGLLWHGGRPLAVPSEGGHADFAPRTEREMALLRHLQTVYGHVSYERLLSGPGLANIFGFLRDVERQPVPEALAIACATGDAAAAISAAALAGDAPIAVDALDLFVSIYGAEAGNWALKLKATGGVYVAGGIAPKVLPKLQDGVFRKAYLAKGRFSTFLEKIPVLVVLEPNVALFGTATYAEARLG